MAALALVTFGASLARDAAVASTSGVAPAYERAQAGWAVASASRRGVMVDDKMIDVSGVYYRAIRLHARTTLLRWHVGSQAPPARYGQVPADAGPALASASAGPAGGGAVFNGAFKVGANAGGSMVDGVTLSPLRAGDMTIALDAAGHWKMGMWAPNFPGAAFHAIALRQNLMPLIANGRLTRAALSSDEFIWGDPLNHQPLEPRSALGIDAHDNLVYVATMAHVSPSAIGTALLAAGAVEGMELDINPYWPILGAPFHALHAPGTYPVQIPESEHNPTIYNTGWERDFFVALAEPDQWNCSWTSPGLGAVTGRAQPQPLHRVCVSALASRTASR